MTTLLRENTHQLLERATRLTHLKLDLHTVAVNKITRKWCIMIGVIPVPTLAALIVISEYPLKSFYVCLLYLLNKLSYIVWICNQELVNVVPHFPAFNSKLYMINVAIDFTLLFGFSDSLCFLYHKILSYLVFLCY